jgi:hypothetical protein
MRALPLAPLLLPVLARAVAASSETVPALAEFDGAHGAGVSLGMIAIAGAFVIVGAWMIYLSARARA